MGWFSKNDKWEESFRLNSRGGAVRGFCAAIFWLWGVGGFLLVGAQFMSLTGSIGVGTSALLAAQTIFWIGGMVLFGFGAILDATEYSAVKKNEDGYGDVRVSR